MAKVKKTGSENAWRPRSNSKQKRTSIGRSKQSRPKNKSKRRSWKKSRGQG